MKKLIILLVVFLTSINIYAISPEEINSERLANAIFKAEGGYKATYLYGIVSIKYKDEAEARKICINTIENNKKRFYNQDKYSDYINFLGSRYCPVGAENDPSGLNKNWIKNVKYFYKKG